MSKNKTFGIYLFDNFSKTKTVSHMLHCDHPINNIYK